MRQIVLPHKFEPRPYQLPVLAAYDRGAKRIVAVWHRRAGKEKVFFNLMIKAGVERVGTYFYFFPTYAQAEKAIWAGMDKDGFPFLRHIPSEIVARKNETKLKVDLINGSVIQLIGTDKIDSIMSTNPVGCVFAEYSLQNPAAWDYVRPILAENDGWAAFDFTPRGKNHGYDIYQIGKREMEAGNGLWFVSRLSVEDTNAISRDVIEAERREGMSDEMIAQEYYVSFEGVQQGSIFGKQLDEAEKGGRICPVPWQPDVAVDTWWDIGTDDPTAIWFTQNVGREIHVIDYYENSGVGLGVDHYIRELRNRPYIYGTHNGPHDLDAHQFAANGRSTKEVAAAMGFKFEVVPNTSKHDGINAGRSIMQRCWFDRDKTNRGRDALASYHYEWSEKRKCFTSEPYHDWSSNGSDAWRYLGVGHKFTKAKWPDKPQGPRLVTVSSGNASWMAG